MCGVVFRSLSLGNGLEGKVGDALILYAKGGGWLVLIDFGNRYWAKDDDERHAGADKQTHQYIECLESALSEARVHDVPTDVYMYLR
ncbi:hypothetical protein KIPB_014994 [Kipferlia bialata]|uniref:Uncharacterized protein n=1 Tax=Kipferlia bialata TaxID=797122 RepID=A0A9K3GPX5_9EUKA|nr:hypothetical protein KIPB_014994 [Kipferlia bialata]|eukprot:g14994.t1